jgi:N6-adenosine-specific RNA methylase IME4
VSGYATILADPPWQYRNFADKAHGAAISNYDTMPLADICAIPVEEWAARDAVLALWGTWPKLPDALAVMGAWGFDYVTGAPWVKTTPAKSEIYTGIGFWFQSTSEILFIGKRGKPDTTRFPILGLLHEEPRQFYAPATRKHSRKPMGVHEWLEVRAPGPRAELFATQEQPGWDCYGLSLGWRLSAEGRERVEPVGHKP